MSLFRKKPLTPEAQEAYDKEYKKHLTELQIQKAKDKAIKDAERDVGMLGGSKGKVLSGILDAGKGFNENVVKKFNTEKFDNFVLGDGKAKKKGGVL